MRLRGWRLQSSAVGVTRHQTEHFRMSVGLLIYTFQHEAAVDTILNTHIHTGASSSVAPQCDFQRKYTSLIPGCTHEY
jgi:hypothetical protein